MLLWQVHACTKTYRHDWGSCPFVHKGEMSARRSPSQHLPILCRSSVHSTDLKEVSRAAVTLVLDRSPARSLYSFIWQGTLSHQRMTCTAVALAACMGRVASQLGQPRSWPILPNLIVIMCLLQKCPLGANCPFAHNHFEYWLHPGRCVVRDPAAAGCQLCLVQRCMVQPLLQQ